MIQKWCVVEMPCASIYHSLRTRRGDLELKPESRNMQVQLMDRRESDWTGSGVYVGPLDESASGRASS